MKINHVKSHVKIGRKNKCENKSDIKSHENKSCQNKCENKLCKNHVEINFIFLKSHQHK